MSVSGAEYRNGNDRDSNPRKLTGLARYEDVTLKRGAIGSLDLYQWLIQIRGGNPKALGVGRHVTGPLNAKGTDVALEELTLAYERLELE